MSGDRGLTGGQPHLDLQTAKPAGLRQAQVSTMALRDGAHDGQPQAAASVSYTHLTLPTN